MPEKTIKVCAYNVQMKDQLPTEAFENTKRAKLIAGLLAKSDYDVLVFSEAFDDGARNEMVKILDAQGNYKYLTYVVGDKPYAVHDKESENLLRLINPSVALLGFGGTLVVGAIAAGLGFISGRPRSDGGIFIMSRWPIEMQSQIVYREGHSWDRFAKKGVSWALINKEGFYFHVFGTHTQSGAVETKGGEREYKYVIARDKQFKALRGMIDAVQMYWLPALIAGDLNVDFCFDKDRCDDNVEGRKHCCSDNERRSMLDDLRAVMPQDLSKYVYTSDPANEFKGGGYSLPTTLDYVFHTESHRKPVRSALETVKLRTPWATKGGRPRNDLSDHYAVVGTFTFPHVREDTPRFVGVWKCVSFNGKPDTHKHGMTFAPFGLSVADDFDGKVTAARIHDIKPGGLDGGTVTLRQLPSNELVTYEYTFKANRAFDRHFIGGEILAHRKPRTQNELVLRGRGRNATYAFESWLPVSPPGEGRGVRGGGGDGGASPGSGPGGVGQGGSSQDTDRQRRER